MSRTPDRSNSHTPFTPGLQARRIKAEKKTADPATASLAPVADAGPDEASRAQTTDPAPRLTGRAAELEKLTKALRRVLERETELLKARQPRRARELHGEKSRLMAEYRDTLNNLKMNTTSLGDEDSAERRHIKALTNSLRDSLRDHARVVLRLKAVAEGLVKSVGEEVAKRDRPVMGYGKNATYRAPDTAHATSLSLNQTI
ncbi:hypothetical protein [Yunchengibacter salinarum]|uniref:hypothetical protein n=1 Tax=Yunchengibacter salinarum TaxID=3133399 RepID=UPI0035B6A65D